MLPRISTDRADESLIAKSLWFASLSDEERLSLYCEISELALANNPQLLQQEGDRRAASLSGAFRVLASA